jgi:hypothetical protein
VAEAVFVARALPDDLVGWRVRRTGSLWRRHG